MWRLRRQYNIFNKGTTAHNRVCCVHVRNDEVRDTIHHILHYIVLVQYIYLLVYCNLNDIFEIDNTVCVYFNVFTAVSS